MKSGERITHFQYGSDGNHMEQPVSGPQDFLTQEFLANGQVPTSCLGCEFLCRDSQGNVQGILIKDIKRKGDSKSNFELVHANFQVLCRHGREGLSDTLERADQLNGLLVQNLNGTPKNCPIETN